MRTAIFVYEPTTLNIHTNESDLQLEQLRGTGALALAPSQNTISVDRGIYKIVSSQCVHVSGPQIEVQATEQNKDDPPRFTGTLPEGYQDVSDAALAAFFTVDAAKSFRP